MRHLTLVSPSEKTIETSERIPRREQIENNLLEAFENCLEAINHQNIPFSTYKVANIDGHKGVESAVADLAENEARYVTQRPVEDNGTTRHMLVIQRSEGSKSVSTFFAMHTDAEATEQATVFQEVTDKDFNNISEGFEGPEINVQRTIGYNPDIAQMLTSKQSATIGNQFIPARAIPEKDVESTALEVLATIIKQAAMQPMDKVVAESYTEEMEIIRKSIRGKGRVRAFGAAVLDFPNSYRHQRQAA